MSVIGPRPQLVRDMVFMTDTQRMRHSLATTMLANNTPVPVITGVLGHASSRTTQKYLSIDVDGLRKVSLEVPE